MPKDKKQGEKKKEEGTSSKEEDVPKRKSSVVDSSSGGSSSSSSTASREDHSGNASDHSAAGDSDSSAGYDEKATMTGDPTDDPSNSVEELACCSSGVIPCTVELRDRTAEMIEMMNKHVATAPIDKIFLIDENNPIPVTDATHLIPIRDGEDSGTEEQASSQPTPSTAQKGGNQQQQPSTSAKQQPAKKKGKQQQQKQMTKKQKKALEAAERLKTQPGPSQPSEEVIVAVDGDLQVHQFQTWSDRACKDGDMIMRGTNAAAKSLCGEAALKVPYLRPGTELGPEVGFTNLHANSQLRYLMNLNTIGNYIAMPAAIKPIHRMGFGIAASGIPDNVPLTLTHGGARSFMKHRYTDYVSSGSKIINWRSDFLTSVVKDRAAVEGEFASVMESLRKDIDRMLTKAPTVFHRELIKTMLQGDARDLLLSFGEIERILIRGVQEWKTIENGVAYQYHPKRFERIRFIAHAIQDWSTTWSCDNHDDGFSQIKACNILQYWASTSAGEKPCHEQNHRKCTMLGFMLRRLDDRHEMFKQKYTGGYTLLHFAAMTGMPCQVDVLLRLGCSLNVLSNQFNSPVSLAMRRHNTLVARQLMWHGADIGGSLTLDHIRVRNAREEHHKQISLFNDSVSRLTPYKAREFISSRLRAINNSFTSWVEALLAEAEPDLQLSIEAVKSSLHQIRIGPDPFESVINIRGTPVLKKSFQLCIEKSQSPTDPVVLFMIPCRYTHHDTTMPANFPHIVRVPMFTNSVEAARKIAEKERMQTEMGLPRTDHLQELADCLPIKLVQNVIVRFGDGVVAIDEPMTPFFQSPHNGAFYGFMISPNISRSVLQMSPITVTFHIPTADLDRFENCFFMAQALQITKRDDGTVEDPRFNEELTSTVEDKLRRTTLMSHSRRFKSPKRKTE